MITKHSYVNIAAREVFPADEAGTIAASNLTSKFSNLQRLSPADPDSRYIQFIAIGNLEVDGFNLNHDGFPYEYFEDERPGYGYRSFVGKRAHSEHNSASGFMGSIGEIVDASLNRFQIPSHFGSRKYAELDSFEKPERQAVLVSPGQSDGTIEILMRIDTKLLKSAELSEVQRRTVEHVLRMVDSGQRVFGSMGMNLSYSTCSACGNTAYVEGDYCDHLSTTRFGSRRGSVILVTANTFRDLIDQQKIRPEWLPQIVRRASDLREIFEGLSNRAVAAFVGEMNHEHSFIEFSVVGNAAFPRAEGIPLAAAASTKESLTKINWNEVSNSQLLEIYSQEFAYPTSRSYN